MTDTKPTDREADGMFSHRAVVLSLLVTGLGAAAASPSANAAAPEHGLLLPAVHVGLPAVQHQLPAVQHLAVAETGQQALLLPAVQAAREAARR